MFIALLLACLACGQWCASAQGGRMGELWEEFDALMALKASLLGLQDGQGVDGAGESGVLAKWELPFPPCARYYEDERVVCAGPASSKLSKLDLSGQGLAGFLPASLDSNGTALRWLTYLDLSNNQLQGPIPGTIARWAPKLQVLLLDNNQLTGPLPGLSKTLTTFSAAGNALTGRLPPEYGSLVNLRELLLSRNRLTGSLPGAVWGRSMVNLRILELAGNELKGPISASWASLSVGPGLDYGLLELQLQDNKLTGPLPPSWGTMHSLRLLNLSNNALQGPLPPAFSGMTTITVLSLSHNKLQGTIPASWSALVRLDTLEVQGNEDLCGDVPPVLLAREVNVVTSSRGSTQSANLGECAWSELAESLLAVKAFLLTGHDAEDRDEEEEAEGTALSSWTWGSNPCGPPAWHGVGCDEDGTLVSLALNSSGLPGVLPTELSVPLLSLKHLNLSNNHLSGPLPPSWHALASLEELDLSSNQLSGILPSAWAAEGACTDRNHHSGKTDTSSSSSSSGGSGASTGSAQEQGPGMCTSLQKMGLANNMLSGGLPAAWAAFPRLTHLLLASNDFQGRLPQEWGAALTSLQVLSLDGNTLTGELPKEWAHMTALFALSVPAYLLLPVSLEDARDGLLKSAIVDLSASEGIHADDLIWWQVPEQGQQQHTISHDSTLSLHTRLHATEGACTLRRSVNRTGIWLSLCPQSHTTTPPPDNSGSTQAPQHNTGSTSGSSSDSSVPAPGARGLRTVGENSSGAAEPAQQGGPDQATQPVRWGVVGALQELQQEQKRQREAAGLGKRHAQPHAAVWAIVVAAVMGALLGAALSASVLLLLSRSRAPPPKRAPSPLKQTPPRLRRAPPQELELLPTRSVGSAASVPGTPHSATALLQSTRDNPFLPSPPASPRAGSTHTNSFTALLQHPLASSHSNSSRFKVKEFSPLPLHPLATGSWSLPSSPFNIHTRTRRALPDAHTESQGQEQREQHEAGTGSARAPASTGGSFTQLSRRPAGRADSFTQLSRVPASTGSFTQLSRRPAAVPADSSTQLTHTWPAMSPDSYVYPLESEHPLYTPFAACEPLLDTPLALQEPEHPLQDLWNVPPQALQAWHLLGSPPPAHAYGSIHPSNMHPLWTAPHPHSRPSPYPASLPIQHPSPTPSSIGMGSSLGAQAGTPLSGSVYAQAGTPPAWRPMPPDSPAHPTPLSVSPGAQAGTPPAWQPMPPDSPARPTYSQQQQQQQLQLQLPPEYRAATGGPRRAPHRLRSQYHLLTPAHEKSRLGHRSSMPMPSASPPAHSHSTHTATHSSTGSQESAQAGAHAADSAMMGHLPRLRVPRSSQPSSPRTARSTHAGLQALRQVPPCSAPPSFVSALPPTFPPRPASPTPASPRKRTRACEPDCMDATADDAPPPHPLGVGQPSTHPASGRPAQPPAMASTGGPSSQDVGWAFGSRAPRSRDAQPFMLSPPHSAAAFPPPSTAAVPPPAAFPPPHASGSPPLFHSSKRQAELRKKSLSLGLPGANR